MSGRLAQESRHQLRQGRLPLPSIRHGRFPACTATILSRMDTIRTRQRGKLALTKVRNQYRFAQKSVGVPLYKTSISGEPGCVSPLRKLAKTQLSTAFSRGSRTPARHVTL